MRISDWSSDVCSSDLSPTSTVDSPLQLAVRAALTERSGPLHAVLALVGSPDAVAERAAIEHQDQLTKPPGSLGRLEQIGAQLAAIAGEAPPPVPAPAAVAVFAGDHGDRKSTRLNSSH